MLQLIEPYYTHAKNMGWIKKECHFQERRGGKVCFPCNCDEVYIKGNISFIKVEKDEIQKTN